MIILFTDFGPAGPYVGQMKAVLAREAPGSTVIELFSDAPVHAPRACAYLLAAYTEEFPRDTVFLCVVDPGVGGSRHAAAVLVDGRWYVGPDNGLFNVVAMRGSAVQWWVITWQPERLSATFHGRDLFAPVAARIARGEPPPGVEQPPAERVETGWEEELAEIIYIDHFGNAMTGIRAASVPAGAGLWVGDRCLPRVRTFSDAGAGDAFWYSNANGLVEIAVNRGRADQVLGLRPGEPVEFRK